MKVTHSDDRIASTKEMDIRKGDFFSVNISGNHGNVREDRQQPIIIQNFDVLTLNQLQFRRKSLSTANLYLSTASLRRQRAPGVAVPKLLPNDQHLLLTADNLPTSTSQARGLALPTESASISASTPMLGQFWRQKDTCVDASTSNNRQSDQCRPLQTETISPVAVLPSASINVASTQSYHYKIEQISLQASKGTVTDNSTQVNHRLQSCSNTPTFHNKTTLDSDTETILDQQSSLPVNRVSSTIHLSSWQEQESGISNDHTDPVTIASHPSNDPTDPATTASHPSNGSPLEHINLTINSNRPECPAGGRDEVGKTLNVSNLVTEGSADLEALQREIEASVTHTGVVEDVLAAKERRAGTLKKVTFKLTDDCDEKSRSDHSGVAISVKTKVDPWQSKGQAHPMFTAKILPDVSSRSGHTHTGKAQNVPSILRPASSVVTDRRHPSNDRPLQAVSSHTATLPMGLQNPTQTQPDPLLDYSHSSGSQISQRTNQENDIPVFPIFHDWQERTNNNNMVGRMLERLGNEKQVVRTNNDTRSSSLEGDRVLRDKRRFTAGSKDEATILADVYELVSGRQKSLADLNTDFLLKIYSSAGDLTRRQQIDVVTLADHSAAPTLIEKNPHIGVVVKSTDVNSPLHSFQSVSTANRLQGQSNVTAVGRLQRSGGRGVSATSRGGNSHRKMAAGERRLFRLDRRLPERTRLNRQLERLVVGRLGFQHSPLLSRSKSAL